MRQQRILNLLREVKDQHLTDYHMALLRKKEPTAFTLAARLWQYRIIGKTKLPRWAKSELEGHLDALYSLVAAEWYRSKD